MKKVTALLLSFLLGQIAFGAVYELRTYVTNPGKLDNLNARFRDHTVGLFKKHGIESIGYWVPTDGEKFKNTLIYVIRHESRDAAKASWKAFGSDPAWKKVAKESQVDGKILAQRPDSVYMNETNYSPDWKNGKVEKDDVFELRIYKAAKGKLGKLDARFRDHTIRIFEKHGMKNVAYWHRLTNRIPRILSFTSSSTRTVKRPRNHGKAFSLTRNGKKRPKPPESGDWPNLRQLLT